MCRAFLALVATVLTLLASACNSFTDGGTRVGAQIESGVRKLSEAEDSRYTIRGITPAINKDCIGPYRAQFDKVGMIAVWCYDNGSADHRVVGGGGTTHAGAYVDTPATWIIDKPAGATIAVDLERRHGRAVIARIY
jgi:hypothetical protein